MSPEPAGKTGPLSYEDRIILDIWEYAKLLERLEKVENFIRSVGGDLDNPPPPPDAD